MAKVGERYNDRELRRSQNGWQLDVMYLVEGVTTDFEAATAVDSTEGTAIPSYGDAWPNDDYAMEVVDIKIRPLNEDRTRYEVTVTYGTPSVNAGDANVSAYSSFSFDTGQQTIHKTQARVPTPSGKSFALSGETAPLSKGIIGWDGKKVNGTDIQYGSPTFSITKQFMEAEFTTTMLDQLYVYNFCVNTDSFLTYDAGEVLFTGASGRKMKGGRPQKLGDVANQIGDYSFTNVSSTNTDNGRIYVSIVEYDYNPGTFLIRLYSNAEKTVIKGQAANAKVGWNTVTGLGTNGIWGNIELVKYVFDTDDIVISMPMAWEVTYKFAISPGESLVEVGDIDVTNKLGWEYLDVFYEDTEQDVSGITRVLKTPKYAYLHKLYPEVSFSFLGIDSIDG